MKQQGPYYETTDVAVRWPILAGLLLLLLLAVCLTFVRLSFGPILETSDATPTDSSFEDRAGSLHAIKLTWERLEADNRGRLSGAAGTRSIEKAIRHAAEYGLPDWPQETDPLPPIRQPPSANRLP